MKTVIGVMGGAEATTEVLGQARTLGRLIAENGWVLLNGGRDAGVMAASSQGAADAGGLVVGILPGDSDEGASEHLTIAIPTGLGDARNAVNVLASRVVVALPGGAGTLSEVALALKSGRPVVTLGFSVGDALASYAERGQLTRVSTPTAAVEAVRAHLGGMQDISRAERTSA